MKMNVLFILADQFRWDCLGAVGNPIIQTPNLDQLARDGVLFRNCFVQTNPCGPSRMCIYTSRYLCSTRALSNETPLRDAEENLGMHLQEAGYNPALIGYNDYVRDPATLPHGHPQKTTPCYDNALPGFNWLLFHDENTSPEYLQWLRSKGYPEAILNPEQINSPNVPPEGSGDHLPLCFPAHYKAEDSEARFIAETAIDWISRRKREGWFLSLNFIKPHPPRICPSPYHNMYDPQSMPEAWRKPDEHAKDHPYYQLMQAEMRLENEQHLRETRANYYGMISELDACLGSLFDFLKSTGEWDRTLIVFSADHGEYLGDHYLVDKAHFFDETMHVPLIIRNPLPEADAARGSHLEGFVESIDLAPTILEFLGRPIPDRFQGQSLLQCTCHPTGWHGKEVIHFEADFRTRPTVPADIHQDECLLWVLRDHHYKYVQFASSAMPPLLFDLQRDPHEFENLAEDPEHSRTVADYCQQMLRWRMRYEDQRMEHWATVHRKR